MTRTRPPAPGPRPPTKDLLFEIGTEELPAAYLPGLLEQLAAEAAALLREEHLAFERVEVFGTPRRLVLLVHGVANVQRRPSEEIRGPSQQAAYDAHGKPTPALTGFLRSRGGRLDQTKLVPSARGTYVYLVKPPTTAPAASRLPEVLPQIVNRLRAPKNMRWDATGARFPRPIRWVVALYGARALRCRVGRLVSAARTRVGAPARLRWVSVRSIPQYLQTLRRCGIVLDHRERQRRILAAVERAATRAGAAPAPELITHGLLEEVTFLTEQPYPLPGRFDRTYLRLPRELLLASMAKYQRVFALDTRQGLRPQCVAILEGKPGNPAAVRAVIERILNARLADSLLFWNADHDRLPLERLAEELSSIVFHESLGTMAQKAQRLRALCEPLAQAWQLPETDHRDLRRACQLAKADLASQVVREFPTLQGVVGTYYARDSHEPEAVAQAIGEQYLPQADRRPQTVLGAALALLDKYDTLTGYFGLGIEPTGDQDPFGLRRAAQGIVDIVWSVRRPLPLQELLRVRTTLDPFRNAQPRDVAAVGQRVAQYLLERLYTFDWPSPRPSADSVEAVLGSARDDLLDVMQRVHMLARLQGDPALLKAAKVIERTRNILKGAPQAADRVDPQLLREAGEQRLWKIYADQHDRIAGLVQARDYAAATTRFGEAFYEPLHRFFDEVLVNDPDVSLQRNRLALMKHINTLYTDAIADLSKLVILQDA